MSNKKTDHEREESYRFYGLGRDIYALAKSTNPLGTDAFWQVITFMQDTALYFRNRFTDVAWAFERDQELIERAINAAASDKPGETLSLLYAIRDLRKETLEGMQSLLDKHKKAVLEGKKEDRCE